MRLEMVMNVVREIVNVEIVEKVVAERLWNSGLLNYCDRYCW